MSSASHFGAFQFADHASGNRKYARASLALTSLEDRNAAGSFLDVLLTLGWGMDGGTCECFEGKPARHVSSSDSNFATQTASAPIDWPAATPTPESDATPPNDAFDAQHAGQFTLPDNWDAPPDFGAAHADSGTLSFGVMPQADAGASQVIFPVGIAGNPERAFGNQAATTPPETSRTTQMLPSYELATAASAANPTSRPSPARGNTPVYGNSPPGYDWTEIFAGAKVTEVTFSGPGYVPIEADPGTPSYSLPHWLDSDHDGATNDDIDAPYDRALPVAWVRNTTGVVSARFAGSKTLFPYLPSDYKLMVRGENLLSAYSPYSFQIPATPVGVEGNDLILPPTAVLQPFGNMVNYGNLTINWSFSNNGGNSWTDAGQTNNELYITLAEPYASPVYHTNLWLAVPVAAQLVATTPEEGIAGAWERFKGRVVNAKHIRAEYADRKLHYYKSWDTKRSTESALLAAGDGNCFAWARLFGLSVVKAGYATQNDVALREIISVAKNPADQSNERLLVKNWVFAPGVGGSKNATYPYVNYLKDSSNTDAPWGTNNNDEWAYVWSLPPVAAPEVTDKLNMEGKGDGIPGQNVTNPLSLFFDHAMIKIGNKFYDPSYGGNVITSLKDWENSAIDGYGIIVSDATPHKLLVRRNPVAPDDAIDVKDVNGGVLKPE